MTADVHDFEAKRAATQATGTSSISSGGGPNPPDLEPRVAALEADVKDVKASLKNLELSSARMEAVLSTLATRSDVERVAGETRALAATVHGVENRVALVEANLSSLGAKVDAKMIGGGQLFAILTGLIAVFVAFGGALIGMLRYLGLPH